jgi:hypothetical protein
MTEAEQLPACQDEVEFHHYLNGADLRQIVNPTE